MKTAFVFKAIIVLFISVILAACGIKSTEENEHGFIVKKESDWLKMNLKGKVKELMERGEEANGSRIISYIKFNENGYIIEKGFLDGSVRDGHRVKETMVYDTDNSLIEHVTYETQHDYDVFRYDSVGNLIEQQYYRTDYQRQISQLNRVDKYQYETVGKRKVDIYRNEAIYATIEYDKYKNEILKTTYNKDGLPHSQLKHEYVYDSEGRLLDKLQYKLRLAPFNEKEEVKHQNSYEYNEQGALVKERICNYVYTVNHQTGEDIIKTYDGKREFAYDVNGNIVYDGKEHYNYQYDFMRNWELKKNAFTYKPLLSRKYVYYDEVPGQVDMMTISVDEIEPCEGSVFTLFVNGGTPFDDSQIPFKIKCYHRASKQELNDLMYIGSVSKKSDKIYSLEILLQISGEDCVLEVEDSKGTKREITVSPSFCG